MTNDEQRADHRHDDHADRRPPPRRGNGPTLDKQYGRQAGFLTKLTTGTGAFNILGYRKIYYAVSGALVDRLDPADHLPRLPVRHRLRRRHHPAVPAERRARPSPPPRSPRSSPRRPASSRTRCRPSATRSRSVRRP